MRTQFRNAVSTLLLAACAASVDAAEWKIDPTINFRAGYNDNIRMNIDNKISSAEATLSPSAVFSVETPKSGLSGNLRFDFRRFEEDSNLNDNNVRLMTNAYRRTETGQLGLDVNFIKDTTLDSQLDNTGLVFFDRVTRYRADIGPNWSYNLNERTSLQFGYTYSDVRYENSDTGFVDFNIHSGRLSLQTVLNERTTASITLLHNETSNDNDVDTRNTNLQGGASYRFSETLSGSLFAGVRRTEADFSQTSLIPVFSGGTIILVPLTSDVSRSDWGYTFSSGLTRSFLRGQTGISASRDISNDANGFPVEVTRINWTNLYRFSATLSGNLDLRFYRSQTNNGARNNVNRDYYTIEPKLTWDFQQFWRISGSYRYRKQKFDETSDDATQNAAYLTLTYRWPRMAVSR